MSDRHQELRRQYELVREHLDWLEREIAREAATAVVPSNAAIPSGRDHFLPPTSTQIAQASAPMATADADAILNDYAHTERHDPDATKRGCLLIFVIVLGVLIVSVTAVYFASYAHR